MKSLVNLFIAAIILGSSQNVTASPFTYSFTEDLSNSQGVINVDLTVDNGGDTNVSQAWTWADLTDLRVNGFSYFDNSGSSTGDIYSRGSGTITNPSSIILASDNTGLFSLVTLDSIERTQTTFRSFTYYESILVSYQDSYTNWGGYWTKIRTPVYAQIPFYTSFSSSNYLQINNNTFSFPTPFTSPYSGTYMGMGQVPYLSSSNNPSSPNISVYPSQSFEMDKH